jgi:hypothetical protein
MQKEEAEVAKWVYAQLNLYVADIVNEQKMVAQTVYDILSNQIGLISKSPNAPMTSRAPTPTMNRLNGMMMGQGMRQGFNQLMNYGSQAYNTLRNLFAKTLSTPPPAPEYSEEYQKFLDNTNVVQIETATKETGIHTVGSYSGFFIVNSHTRGLLDYKFCFSPQIVVGWLK